MESDFYSQVTLVGYLLIAVAVICLQALTYPGGRRVWMLSLVARSYLRCLFHWRENKACPFPQEGPAIIIANHSSPMDPMLVWAGRRRIIGFMMAREFYEVKYVHWIFRLMQSIPVERNGKDMGPTRKAFRRLKSGELVGIFPEGGINTEQRLLPGNPGVAWLALRSKAPVFPVYICNAPGGDNMIQPFINFTHTQTKYGDQIDLSPFYDRPRTQELLKEVTNYLMSHLAALGDVDYSRVENGKRLTDSAENHSPKGLGRAAIDLKTGGS